VAAYRSRRDLLVQAFAPIDGLTLSEPQGAFFAFTDCSALLGRRTPAGRVIDTDLAFVDYLLTEHGVAAVDGTSFGSPGHFRLSIAAGTDSIAQAAQRIAHACASLSQ
jgi:aspartate aminotransferase